MMNPDHADDNPRLTPGVRDALEKVIDYLDYDERQNFEEYRDNGLDTSNHIWLSVKALKDWLGMEDNHDEP